MGWTKFLALVRGRQGVGFAVMAGQVVVQACVSKLAKLIDTVQGGFVVVWSFFPMVVCTHSYTLSTIMLETTLSCL
jgi:hypothetical protein